MIEIVIYAALALTFLVTVTGLSAVMRNFASIGVQSVIVAVMIGGTWAPVRWWGAEDAHQGWFGGWHPLIGNWLLGQPANRPDLTYASFALTSLLSYAAISWWSRRARQAEQYPPDATLDHEFSGDA